MLWFSASLHWVHHDFFYACGLTRCVMMPLCLFGGSGCPFGLLFWLWCCCLLSLESTGESAGVPKGFEARTRTIKTVLGDFVHFFKCEGWRLWELMNHNRLEKWTAIGWKRLEVLHQKSPLATGSFIYVVCDSYRVSSFNYEGWLIAANMRTHPYLPCSLPYGRGDLPLVPGAETKELQQLEW